MAIPSWKKGRCSRSPVISTPPMRAVLGGDHRERVADLGGSRRGCESCPPATRASGVAAEHEQRERRRVAADRRLGLGGAARRAPTALPPPRRPVAGEQARLDRADRPPPAARRRVRPALAVALGRAREPFGASPSVRASAASGRRPRRRCPCRVSCRCRASGSSASRPRRPRSASARRALSARDRPRGEYARAGQTVRVEPVRELNEVYWVDGLRTAFGRAGPKGVFWRTRADDMAVKAMRELLRRNPKAAARADRRRRLRRDRAGRRPGTDARPRRRPARRHPAHRCPGFALDRMCAGALTAVTAGGGRDRVRRRRRRARGRRRAHGPPPDGRRGRLQPALRRRAARRHLGGDDGRTAENLHDRFPKITKERADAFAVRSHQRRRGGVGRTASCARRSCR